MGVRPAVAILAGTMFVVSARADVNPPPGQKRVPRDYEIEAAEDFADYAFYLFAPKVEFIRRVEIGKDKVGLIPGAGRTGIAREGSLVAVPKASLASFPNEEVMKQALVNGDVPGILRAQANFSSTTDIPASDPNDRIVVRYRIMIVDPKEGLFLNVVSVTQTGEDGKPSGYTLWIVITLVLGVAGLGVWVARRKRNTASPNPARASTDTGSGTGPTV
jgi:hypothetical protein